MVIVPYPQTAIYLRTKFHFNPFCTFQDMIRIGIHYEKIRGDNFVNIQGKNVVLVYCPSPHCHLSINQVSFQSLFQDIARTGIHYEKKMVKGK